MADIKPIGLYDEGDANLQSHDVFKDGDQMDAGYIEISGVTGNVITTEDGGLLVLPCDVGGDLFIDCEGNKIPCGAAIATCEDLSKIQQVVNNITNVTNVINPSVPSPIIETDSDYYVDSVGGSDSNSGTKSSPFKTLDKAFEETNEGMSNTIFVKEGSDVSFNAQYNITAGAVRNIAVYGDTVDAYRSWWEQRQDSSDPKSVDSTISADEQIVWNTFGLNHSVLINRPVIRIVDVPYNSYSMDVGGISMEGGCTINLIGLVIDSTNSAGSTPVSSENRIGAFRGDGSNKVVANGCIFNHNEDTRGCLLHHAIGNNPIPSSKFNHCVLNVSGSSGNYPFIQTILPATIGVAIDGASPYNSFTDPLPASLQIVTGVDTISSYAYIQTNLITNDAASALIGNVVDPSVISGAPV